MNKKQIQQMVDSYKPKKEDKKLVLPPALLLHGASKHPDWELKVRCDYCIKGKCGGEKHMFEGETIDETGAKVWYAIKWVKIGAENPLQIGLEGTGRVSEDKRHQLPQETTKGAVGAFK